MYNYIKSKIRSKIESKLRNIVAEINAEANRFTKPYIKRKCIESECFDFYIANQEGMDWYDRQCTDPFWPELAVARTHLLEKGDVVLDAGAHHGCTAICFSRWVGEAGKVYAIEPNPENCAVITINLAINKISNVEIVPSAVGERVGNGLLSVQCSNSNMLPAATQDTVDVDVIPLDSLYDAKPTFIKLDVEGVDVLALRGAKKILATYPKLLIEVHKDAFAMFDTTLEEMMHLIDWDAYDCWVQWNYERDIAPWTFASANLQDSMARMVHGTHIFAKPKSK